MKNEMRSEITYLFLVELCCFLVQWKMCRLCVYVLINKRSFELFMSLDLVLE